MLELRNLKVEFFAREIIIRSKSAVLSSKILMESFTNKIIVFAGVTKEKLNRDENLHETVLRVTIRLPTPFHNKSWTRYLRISKRESSERLNMSGLWADLFFRDSFSLRKLHLY